MEIIVFKKILIPIMCVLPITVNAENSIKEKAFNYLSGKANSGASVVITNTMFYDTPEDVGPLFDKNNMCQLWGNGWVTPDIGKLSPNVKAGKEGRGKGFLILTQNKIGEVKYFIEAVSDFSILRSYKNHEVKIPILTGRTISDIELNRQKNAMSALIQACGGQKHLFD
jgi:hypothetical protein